MTRSLSDVLASPAKALNQVPGGAQTSQFYVSKEHSWAAAARVQQENDDIEVYDPRDGNQFAFLSSRPPGQNSRPGMAPVKQVTCYNTGTILFKNVAVVDPATISEEDMIAGQLWADKYGLISLSESEKAELLAELGIAPADDAE